MTNLSAAILDPLLQTDPVSPRITYYDDSTGERIELSTVTLANWAAKTGNLLRDELGAGPTSRVTVLLPAHWQTVAVLFGVWWIGAEVVLDGPADIALCTVARLPDADTAVCANGANGEVVVLSLDPFGRQAAGLPVGVTDYATAVRVHGDHIDAERHPGPALAGRSVGQVLAECAAVVTAVGLTPADRVWSANRWDSAAALVANLLGVLAAGASLVQVHHPDPAVQQRRRNIEKITRSFEC